jgi:hypothetical protein
MSKVISSSKDLKLREKTVGFAEAFIDQMNRMEISDYDFLSINLFFESVVSINAMTDKYSIKYQKFIGEKFRKFKMNPILFKNYLSSISALLSSNTEIHPEFFKIMVDNVTTGKFSLYFKYFTIFNESMQGARKIRQIFDKNPKDITEQEKVIKNSMVKLLKFLMFKLEEQLMSSNFVLISKLYRNYLSFVKERIPSLEKELILMSQKRGNKEFLLNMMELEILVSEVGEKLGPEIVQQLLQINGDNILLEESVFKSSIAFNKHLEQITTLNYNLKKSQISRNFNEYPHFVRFISSQNKFLEYVLKNFNSDTI